MFKLYEYHWSGINRFQQKQKGKRLAKSQEELENFLLKKGYQQIKISRNFIFPKKPKSEEITQIISQLAMLIQAKIPLKQALNMVLENCSQIKLYLWLEDILRWIETGYSFSVALEKAKTYLPQQEIQLIKMGEVSGKLDLILKNVAQARAESERLAKKVKKILFYPLMILAISLLLSVGLLLFIVPQFAELYGAKEKTFPFITKILFNLSYVLQNNIEMLIVFVIWFTIFFNLLSKKLNFMRYLKSVLLAKIPVFSQIHQYYRIVFFHQNLALMLKASIRLDVILKTFLSEKSEDPILQQEIITTLNLLKQGYSLSESLNFTVFNEQVIQMLYIGEKSGNLAEMSEHISDIYQQKLDYQIDILSQLLEPVLMLVMGVIVGTIMVGLYLPIFDMGSLVE